MPILLKFFGRERYYKNHKKVKLFNIRSIERGEEEEIEFMSYSCFDISEIIRRGRVEEDASSRINRRN